MDVFDRLIYYAASLTINITTFIYSAIKVDRCKVRTTPENAVADVRHRARNGYGSQGGTVFEGTEFDGSNTIWDTDRGEGCASVKDVWSDVSDRGGDIDRGEGSAA